MIKYKYKQTNLAFDRLFWIRMYREKVFLYVKMILLLCEK